MALLFDKIFNKLILNKPKLNGLIQFGLLLVYLSMAVMTRLIPHPWGVTAVGAVSLLSGREFRNPIAAVLFTLALMFVSDLFLGFHETVLYVYGSLALIVLLANVFKTRLFKGTQLMGASLVGSLVFFAITNFGVWMEGSLYPASVQGLLECFVMGLPFLKFQILGDMAFTFGLFYLWDLVLAKSLKTFLSEC